MCTLQSGHPRGQEYQQGSERPPPNSLTIHFLNVTPDAINMANWQHHVRHAAKAQPSPAMSPVLQCAHCYEGKVKITQVYFDLRNICILFVKKLYPIDFLLILMFPARNSVCSDRHPWRTIPWQRNIAAYNRSQTRSAYDADTSQTSTATLL